MKRYLLQLVSVCSLLYAHGQAGSLDTSFARKGWVTTGFEKADFNNEYGWHVLPQKDGSYITVFGINDYTLLARYLSNGTLDSSFGSNGFSDFANLYPGGGAALQSDGKIVVAGFTYTSSTLFDFGIARYNSNGTLDKTFDGDGQLTADFTLSFDVVNSLAIQKDGKIVVAGYTAIEDTNALNIDGKFALARYNSDGTPDKTFDRDGRLTTNFNSWYDIAFSLAIQSDGKMVAAGESIDNDTGETDFVLARYKSNGNLDKSFGGDGKVFADFTGSASATSLAIQGDGKIVAAGYTDNGSIMFNSFALARYKTNGDLDESFDGDGMLTTYFITSQAVKSVAIQKDGKIVAAGYSFGYRPNFDNYDFALARYNSNGSLDNSFGGDGIVTTDFTSKDNYPRSLALESDGKIIMAGYMENNVTGNFDFALARYTTDGNLDNTFSDDGWLGGHYYVSNSVLLSIAIQSDGKIVTAGNSYNYRAGYNDFALARYHYDGTPDNTFDGDGLAIAGFGAEGSAYSIALQNDGKIVTAGLVFNSGAGWDFALARFNNDGSPDNSFDGDGKLLTDFGGDEFAQSLVIQGDGKIIASGYTSSISGFNFDFALARYNSDGSLDNTFDGDGKRTTDIGPYDNAAAIALQRDGKIIAAGSANSNFAVLRYNSNGSIDNTFDGDGIATTNFGGTSDAYSVALQNDGKIVAGGTTYGNTFDYNFALARYHSNGSPDKSFSGDGKQTGDFSPLDFAGSLAIQNDGKILLGGYIATSNGHDFALARYNGNGVPDSTFDGDGFRHTGFGGNSNYGFSLAHQGDRAYVAGSTLLPIVTKGVVAVYHTNCAFTFYRDYDKDGYGNPDKSVKACAAPAGYVAKSGDCNDAKKTVYPGAPELCDNLDNDCDGQADEGLTLTTFYRDYDKDGYGNYNLPKTACIAPAGYVAAGGDCNDTKKTIYPGAPELCDNLDNDCDGMTDEGFVLKTFYRDYDKDGYGNNNATKTACIAPAGYVTKSGDCNDNKKTVYPGAPEMVNGIDDNCNGIIDENTTVSVPNTAAKEAPAYSLQVKATPNPSARYFNLVIQSSSGLPVQVRVLNVMGNTVESRSKIAPNTTLQIGALYGTGIYIAEVVQGTEKRMVKLVKRPEDKQ